MKNLNFYDKTADQQILDLIMLSFKYPFMKLGDF